MDRSTGRVAPTLALAFGLALGPTAAAQRPPSTQEVGAYRVLFAAAHAGDDAAVAREVAAGAPIDARDAHGRTPLIVASRAGRAGAMRALAGTGANPNALDRDRYDIVTIAAVANDVPTLALALGASARNVTSPYEGTALVAGADLKLPDRHGATPLALARQQGYAAMATILERAGAR
jgi:ankyrin repeat protein